VITPGARQKMAGNEQIASEVGKNPNGAGYVGLAYTKAGGIKVMPIDGVSPSTQTVHAKTYPYASADILLHEWRTEWSGQGGFSFHHRIHRAEDRRSSGLCSDQSSDSVRLMTKSPSVAETGGLLLSINNRHFSRTILPIV